MTWIKLFNREVKLRPFVLSSTLRKIRGKWRDGKYTGRIVITGSVEITNGPKHAGPYRNHFVNNALQALGYILMTNIIFPSGQSGSNYATPLYPTTMYLGTNTIVATFPNMVGLVAPIGTPPGTGPNSFSSSYGSITNGYQVLYSATWNAGTVSGTIGEMALYGTFTKTYYTGNNNNLNWGTHTGMLSRLSVADGDFSAFTINTSYPLVIAWTIQFVFA